MVACNRAIKSLQATIISHAISKKRKSGKNLYSSYCTFCSEIRGRLVKRWIDVVEEDMRKREVVQQDSGGGLEEESGARPTPSSEAYSPG